MGEALLKLGYRPALDGLRGLAVLLVLGGHAGVAVMHHSQNVGVTAFFTLSGFLITFLLLAEIATAGKLNIAAFYWRRALRLLPALFVMVAALAAAVAVAVHVLHRLPAHHQDKFWRGAASAVLYIGNFVRAEGGNLTLFNHTWSLSVEEQFYLVWPVVIIGLTWALRNNPRRIALALTILTVAFTAWRFAMLFVFDNGLYAYYGPDTNAFALAAGAALAAWMRCTPAARLHPRFAALGLAIIMAGALCPVSVLYLHPVTPQIPAFSAVIGTLLVLSGSMDGNALLEWTPLRWLGTISYGVYLWHYPLIRLATYEPWGLPQPWLNLGMCALSVVVAASSFYLIEKPILRHKHLLDKRPVPQDTTEPAAPARLEAAG